MAKRKIKIIHIIPTLDIGGAERILVDLAKNINKDIFDIKIICLKRIGVWGMELKNRGIEMILIRQNNKLAVLSLIKLIKILKQERPDIVHTHLFGADFFGRLAAHIAGIKNVITTEHNLNFQESLVKNILKRITNKLAKKIIAVSGAVKEYLVNTQGVEASKIKIIYNGVDVTKFANYRRNRKADGGQVIGSLGRLTKQKDFQVLIEAVASLNNPSVGCLIAGEGELRGQLLKKINNSDLTGKVKLIGRQVKLDDFFKSIDLFVLPSLWEGFGLSLVEAGLAGLPVIASRVDGIKEIIDDGQNGLLFMPGDQLDLAGKIDFLLRNPEEKLRLSDNFINKIKEKFNLDRMVKEYETIYLDMI